MASKKVREKKKASSKQVNEVQRENYDKANPIWMFDRLDNDGDFYFSSRRNDFEHKIVLWKMIDYSNMPWSAIMAQTHDDGKSKHHFLKYSSLSAEARQRIARLHLEEETDNIFSFAIQSKLRIIGIRKRDRFHVIWYDPKHKFCPVTK